MKKEPRSMARSEHGSILGSFLGSCVTYCYSVSLGNFHSAELVCQNNHELGNVFLKSSDVGHVTIYSFSFKFVKSFFAS